jgi:hypothetical protein
MPDHVEWQRERLGLEGERKKRRALTQEKTIIAEQQKWLDGSRSFWRSGRASQQAGKRDER